VKLKVDVQTVSGTISSYKPITCCVIEENEDYFLVTNQMLKAIGIDVDQQVIDKASEMSLPRELVWTVSNDGDDIDHPRIKKSSALCEEDMNQN
jgi:hypothetical protein